MKGWRPRWNLWHLVVSVFVTALILGAIRFLGSDPMALQMAALFVACLIGTVPGVTAIHHGIKLANQTTRGWKEQGRLRGGQDGLFQTLLARLAQAIIVLVSLYVGTAFFVMTTLIIGCFFALLACGWQMVSIRFGW